MAGLAGCTGLLGSASTPTAETESEDTDERTGPESTAVETQTDSVGSGFVTSFEEEGLPAALVDVSETDAPAIAVTDEYASEGEQSLLLTSTPGTTTQASVAASEPVSVPTRTTVQMKLVDGSNTSSDLGLNLIHAQTEAMVQVKILPHRDGVALVGRNSTTVADPTYQQAFDDVSFEEQWYRVTLNVKGTEVIATVGAQEQKIPLPTPMESGEVYPSLNVNSWGSGGTIAMAFDEFRVTERARS